jgi:thiamine biosynthesis lipoprotein
MTTSPIPAPASFIRSGRIFSIRTWVFCFEVALILLAPAAARAEPDGPVVSRDRSLMGTEVLIKVAAPDTGETRDAIEAAFAEVSRLEGIMSNFIPASELSRINDSAGRSPVVVSSELYGVIDRAIYYSELTGGAFDISFASVGRLWDFRKQVVPSEESVRKNLGLVDYREIRLDPGTKSVLLARPGMEIGLGGIGKGYAVDRAMAVLAGRGIKNAMVMAGGDTLIRGSRYGEPWRVGLRNPDVKDGILAVLPLEDQAISTSGDYERFFIKDGVRYHHILDPRTGFPARGCRSVTILAPDASTSDPLATGVFVLGPEKGIALIEKLDGVEGIIVDGRGTMRLSSGLEKLGIQRPGDSSGAAAGKGD